MLKKSEEQLKNKILRVYNKESLTSSYILSSLKYKDLSPQEAVNIYQNQDSDFTIIDLTENSFESEVLFEERVHIPYSELLENYDKIGSKNRRIILISETGLTSILAANFLASKGYHHLNNISGGYKYWPIQEESKLSIAN